MTTTSTSHATSTPLNPKTYTTWTAHLNGGIPDRDIDALGSYWTVFRTLRQTLFESNGRAGYSEPRIETQQVKAAILGHGEFESYRQRVAAICDSWRKNARPLLRDIDSSTSPNRLSAACLRICWLASPTCLCSNATTSTSG